MYPTISYEGYFHLHAPQEILDRLEKKKERKKAVKADLAKVNKEISGSDENKEMAKGYGELERWFKERRKEMTGKCANCGGMSCKYKDSEYKRSIAHILPKAYFPSVATHEKNWLELCFYGKSCHTNMDNKMLDLTEMACWDEIVTKFCVIYPDIDKKERKRIPEILLQYVEVEK